MDQKSQADQPCAASASRRRQITMVTMVTTTKPTTGTSPANQPDNKETTLPVGISPANSPRPEQVHPPNMSGATT
jgi:hypothetical protein